jgi:hypothetical protein
LAALFGFCRLRDCGCYQLAWRFSPMTFGPCDRSGPELWIGSNITDQIGWLMDLARNDPS